MRKKSIAKSLNWDAHYVGIKATRERQQNCITLEELVSEVLPLLSPFAPITIEDQIPVFTEWAGRLLSKNIPLRKSNSWYRPRLY
jgi:hypothetical protein